MNKLHHRAAAAMTLGLLSLASCAEGPRTAGPGAEAHVDLPAAPDGRSPITLALALEQAERRLDAGREIPAARRAISEALADPALTPEQRDQAKLAMSRVLEAEGDLEGAVAAVEDLLGDHALGDRWPLQGAAEKRLRLLVTGTEEEPPAQEPAEPEHASPFAHALARYFPVPESGPREVTIGLLAFGGSTDVSDRLGTFALAPAIRALRRKACPRCDGKLAINRSSSRTDSWVGIPSARAELGSSLVVFYFDLGKHHIPARYDAELPMPTAEIVARLSRGEGVVAARERGGAPPAILIAAPRGAQLAVVEEALAAMKELPAAPVSVPLPDGLLPGEIQSVVRTGFPAFRGCYETLVARRPDAAGKIPLSFTVLGDGAVADVRVDADKATLRDGAMDRCMVEATRALRFPGTGHKTTVVYPVEFSPGD